MPPSEKGSETQWGRREEGRERERDGERDILPEAFYFPTWKRKITTFCSKGYLGARQG